jgi:hypothetical protein
MENRASLSGRIIVITALWFLVALAAGAFGFVAALKPPFPQVILFGLTALLLLLFWRLQAFQHWILAVDLRVLLLIHLTRFVGIYFLILYGRGELPYAFAVPGGWGDIITATTVTLLLLLSSLKINPPRSLYLLWNLFGTIDIFMVVIAAIRSALKEPQSMNALLKLPLSLLVTFIVPLIIFTHLVLFVRLLRQQSRVPAL